MIFVLLAKHFGPYNTNKIKKHLYFYCAFMSNFFFLNDFFLQHSYCILEVIFFYPSKPLIREIDDSPRN